MVSPLLRVCVVALVCFVGGSRSSCPYFQKAVEIARDQFEIRVANERQLIDDGYVVQPNSPGSLFNSNGPIDPNRIGLYNQSDILLSAEQLYQGKHHDVFSGKLDDCLDDALLCAPAELCEKDYPYRSFSGACNNKKNPKWGTAYTPYNRMLAANYDDNIFEIRRTIKSGKELPSVRLIANVALQEPAYPFILCRPLEEASYLGIMWGQFITHDIGLREIVQDDKGGSSPLCCTFDNTEKVPANKTNRGCDAVSVPKNDPYYGPLNVGCFNNYRSRTVVPNNCTIQAAQQANVVSHFVDSSNVYGSQKSVSDDLRTGSGGQYKNNDAKVLPIREGCTGPLAECYTIGDPRVTQTPMLIVLHSLILRLHNQIAELLADLNGHWDDERLFQESRRTTIAIYQHIVYEEWLVLFFGKKSANKFGLACGKDVKYCGKYDPKVDPSTLNENSHAAFRLFHLYVPSIFRLFRSDFSVIKTFNLSDVILDGELAENNYDSVLRGMFLDKMNLDRYNDELRNKIFNTTDTVVPQGLDLLSNDIQKGRDHGFEPYVRFYEHCTNTKINNWLDLLRIMSLKTIKNLRKVYDSVYDVDLLVGIFLEDKSNGFMGPVAECIIGEQFARAKFGDRFFYSFSGQFNEDQLTEIKSFDIAKLLCSVTKLEKVTAKPFEVPGKIFNQPTKKCSKFSKINLEAWRETPKTY